MHNEWIIERMKREIAVQKVMEVEKVVVEV